MVGARQNIPLTSLNRCKCINEMVDKLWQCKVEGWLKSIFSLNWPLGRSSLYIAMSLKRRKQRGCTVLCTFFESIITPTYKCSRSKWSITTRVLTTKLWMGSGLRIKWSKSPSRKNNMFGTLQTILLCTTVCIVGELARGGSIVLIVGVSDMWQV